MCAHAFSFKYPVIGFDINKDRIDELNLLLDKLIKIKKMLNGLIKHLKDRNAK